jgi:hypothetical protein
MIDPTPIRARFASLSPHLDERERRLLAATEARLAGYGGIAMVARATGVAASTIGRGLRDLAVEGSLDPDRVRREGGGRKPLTVTDPGLLPDLLSLVEPDERAIRCRRCAGRAKVCANWRVKWPRWAIGSAAR